MMLGSMNDWQGKTTLQIETSAATIWWTGHSLARWPMQSALIVVQASSDELEVSTFVSWIWGETLEQSFFCHSWPNFFQSTCQSRTGADGMQTRCFAWGAAVDNGCIVTWSAVLFCSQTAPWWLWNCCFRPNNRVSKFQSCKIDRASPNFAMMSCWAPLRLSEAFAGAHLKTVTAPSVTFTIQKHNPWCEWKQRHTAVGASIKKMEPQVEIIVKMWRQCQVQVWIGVPLVSNMVCMHLWICLLIIQWLCWSPKSVSCENKEETSMKRGQCTDFVREFAVGLIMLRQWQLHTTHPVVPLQCLPCCAQFWPESALTWSHSTAAEKPVLQGKRPAQNQTIT